ncbi:quinone oxidoreductase family protein [Amycolatopsis palatopharyngis]|uniref:quinone oxidoreductase family protein n=1 Tax=Amycolatopsis palatopharyngis TaxID=187982 RepID=UPI000E2216B9|nr:zinc-binding alcohol dehydrogenase family protein [Amycolatopsis palatopharyngis]
MRAAVVSSTDRPPEVGEFPEPPETGDVGRVLAAGLNPVDRAIAAGSMPLHVLRPPAVAGFEGIAERADGSRVYFSAPRAPYGSFAERVPLAGAETAPVPAGLDPVAAAAIGVPGIAAWLALTKAGALQAGESVLVLGATGAVGRVAIQAARALGASRIVGTARSSAGFDLIERTGASAVSTADPDVLASELTRVAAGGFDVVVDTLWGPPLVAALGSVRRGGRIAQVGNAAGVQADVAAPAFRNRRVSIVGHSNFLASAQDREVAFGRVAELAAQGALRVDSDAVPLAEFGAAWQGLADGGPTGKVVIVP